MIQQGKSESGFDLLIRLLESSQFLSLENLLLEEGLQNEHKD